MSSLGKLVIFFKKDTFSIVISVNLYCEFQHYHLDYTRAQSHTFGEHFNIYCSLSVIGGENKGQNQSD